MNRSAMAKFHLEHHKVDAISWLRAAVLGANDGIVSTASLLVGVVAANATHENVLLTGVAGLVAGPCRWPPANTSPCIHKPTVNTLP
jgi:VIT1/CCC1 family predicted Fe2+/Mn2+ transporter